MRLFNNLFIINTNLDKDMANLLNLKIKLNLNGNALHVDSGNMTQTELINAIRSIDPSLMQYLDNSQLGAIHIEDNVHKFNWNDISDETKGSIIDFISQPQKTNSVPKNKSNYEVINIDEQLTGATARTTSDNEAAEALLLLFKYHYTVEEIDDTVNKIFLYSKQAIAALNSSIVQADDEGDIVLNDITPIRPLDPDDVSSDTAIMYAYNQGLTIGDVVAYFSILGITVITDTNINPGDVYIKDNRKYIKTVDGNMEIAEAAEVTLWDLSNLPSEITSRHGDGVTNYDDTYGIVFSYGDDYYGSESFVKHINAIINELNIEGEDISAFDCDLIDNGNALFTPTYGNSAPLFIIANNVLYKRNESNNYVVV